MCCDVIMSGGASKNRSGPFKPDFGLSGAFSNLSSRPERSKASAVEGPCVVMSSSRIKSAHFSRLLREVGSIQHHRCQPLHCANPFPEVRSNPSPIPQAQGSDQNFKAPISMPGGQMRSVVISLSITILLISSSAQTSGKARVFISDSQSWEMSGNAGGANGTFAAHSAGGARPQTAEIVKTFGERCPDVIVNNKSDKADYVVLPITKAVRASPSATTRWPSSTRTAIPSSAIPPAPWATPSKTPATPSPQTGHLAPQRMQRRVNQPNVVIRQQLDGNFFHQQNFSLLDSRQRGYRTRRKLRRKHAIRDRRPRRRPFSRRQENRLQALGTQTESDRRGRQHFRRTGKAPLRVMWREGGGPNGKGPASRAPLSGSPRIRPKPKTTRL